MLPEPIKKFVEVFSRLPSIGPRQATRLAFYIASLGKNTAHDIATAVSGLSLLTSCTRCFRTHSASSLGTTRDKSGQAHSGKLCSICSDPTRSFGLIALVEKETDLLSLEKTKKFSGWYFVTGNLNKGELEPEQKLRLASLKTFITKELKGKAEEIIFAMNPTIYGDLNAATLKKELEGYAGKITRLGRGIPTGGEIEFADENTL
ncbi:MAG: toprim domain-containing protein, partial [bacterium]|nr:toprim domain-containing protein [bacterium]